MLLGITGGALLAIGVFNILADPFRVFGTPRRTGINDRVPDTSGFDRMAKPYELLRIAPRTVLFGSSTAHAGFLDFGDWKTSLPKPAFNYALLGASAHEIRLSLAQALRKCPVETVIIVADFFAFNAHYLDNERFDAARLEAATHRGWPGFVGTDLAAFAVGREALGLSWETITTSRRAVEKAGSEPQWWQDYPWHVHFRNCERSYLAKWFPPPASKYEFASAQTGNDRLADFDASLHLCAERAVRLIVLCPPIHARFQEALSATGAWPHYERWKRQLASHTLSQRAKRSGQGTVELWDFSIFNDLTCEPLPQDGMGRMHYFSDSAHFTPKFGQLILDEILGSAPTRLGVRLDRVEIETHLAGIRAALEAFRMENPGVVTDVRAGLEIGRPSVAAPMASAMPGR